MTKQKNQAEEKMTQEVFEGLILNYFKNFKTFGDMQGLDSENLEALYAAGHNYYTHGKYKEALDLFRACKQMNHFEPKYIMGMGACKQMLKDWQGAIDCYGMVTFMDPLNPVPAFHCSECLLQLKDVEGAKKALELTMEIVKISEDEHYEELSKRAEVLLKSLSSGDKEKKK